MPKPSNNHTNTVAPYWWIQALISVVVIGFVCIAVLYQAIVNQDYTPLGLDQLTSVQTWKQVYHQIGSKNTRFDTCQPEVKPQEVESTWEIETVCDDYCYFEATNEDEEVIEIAVINEINNEQEKPKNLALSQVNYQLKRIYYVLGEELEDQLLYVVRYDEREFNVGDLYSPTLVHYIKLQPNPERQLQFIDARQGKQAGYVLFVDTANRVYVYGDDIRYVSWQELPQDFQVDLERNNALTGSCLAGDLQGEAVIYDLSSGDIR